MREFEDLSGKIIGAAIEVHKILGPGFLESIYREAMKLELGMRGIPYKDEEEIEIYYKDEKVGLHRLDILVADQIVVELKAAKAINENHMAQTLSYLKATGLEVGLVLNFKPAKLEIKRIVLGAKT